jgi:uncharacterized MnhB-related membrane protein
MNVPIFDLLLGLSLVWLAYGLLSTPDLFKAIVLFTTLGLVTALAWARLRAPDIALAEAAIGAGITGALLLDARRRMETAGDGPPAPQGKQAK